MYPGRLQACMYPASDTCDDVGFVSVAWIELAAWM
jgi:hypothetical protein